MTTCIVVYSRTGTSARLAKAMAAVSHMDISTITCTRYDGARGLLRAIWDRWHGALPEVKVSPPIGDADRIIVCGPLWFGRLSPPVQRLLRQHRRMPPIAGIVVTQHKFGRGYDLEQDLYRRLPAEVLADVPVLRVLTREVATDRGQVRLERFVVHLKPLFARPVPKPAPMDMLRILARHDPRKT